MMILTWGLKIGTNICPAHGVLNLGAIVNDKKKKNDKNKKKMLVKVADKTTANSSRLHT